jgi:putative ABC transport system substrate-binding protein
VTSKAEPVRSDAEIVAVFNSLARQPGGGVVTPPDGFINVHRELIASLAARNKIPAIAAVPAFVRDGGLISYGAEPVDIFHRSASYVDRILRGAKPSELPVQVPVKFVMAVNIKAANKLGLTMPQSILLRADEVIE